MAGKKVEPLAVVHRDCAGIDVGKRKHYVAVDPSRFDEPVRNFGTFTQDLEAMAEWLSSCGVREVAMESTGVYWVPVFERLDRAGFEVHLVNPRATKQVSGRKSDVLDCQWIRQLMSYGLLRGAFRSPDALCPMRSYVTPGATGLAAKCREALGEPPRTREQIDNWDRSGHELPPGNVAPDGSTQARRRDRVAGGFPEEQWHGCPTGLIRRGVLA